MENIFIFLPIFLSILVTGIYYYVTYDRKFIIIALSLIGLLLFTPIFILLAALIIYKGNIL